MRNKIKDMIKNLPENEAKTVLFDLFIQMDSVKKKNYQEAELLEDMDRIYTNLIRLMEYKKS
ncbi:hypothetical protein [Niallia nealsonii]|uniref:Uncharacterized protein n=1 Tax=Niallia nealsonii TaxID=115979 RepID=A0A2N0Z1R9_9BACI|nr:hypothetical protein [Niallia nealsonii]PKG23458.1 hypothetical protein CWS01_11770 [Niallia nealsonii]